MRALTLLLPRTGAHVLLRMLAAALVLASAATPCLAQNGEQWRTHKEVGDVTFIAANALLGGLTAGAVRELRGGSFSDGFAAGALGGAIAYGGRRLAAQPFTGAGFAGRQAAAVGSSMVRNSAALRPVLSHVVLPLGPVLLDVRLDRRPRVLNARLDLATTGWILAGIADDRVHFMLDESLSAGAPVFHAPRHRLRGSDDFSLASTFRGLIILGRDAAPQWESVLAHERAHILQMDFVRELWSTPIEQAVLSRVPGGTRLLRHAELNVTWPLFQHLLVQAFGWSWEERPWEIEADFLQNR